MPLIFNPCAMPAQNEKHLRKKNHFFRSVFIGINYFVFLFVFINEQTYLFFHRSKVNELERWGPVRWINLCWHFCLMKLVCSRFIIKRFYLMEHLKIRLYWEALWTISKVKAYQQFWMNFQRVNPSFGHSHFRSIYTVTGPTSARIGVCQWFCNFCISLTWNILLDQKTL